MSIPDILLDVGVTMATNQDCKSHTSTDSGLPSTLSQGSEKSKLSPSPVSTLPAAKPVHTSAPEFNSNSYLTLLLYLLLKNDGPYSQYSVYDQLSWYYTPLELFSQYQQPIPDV